MPRHYQYKIGDFVHHDKLGDGIILAQKHTKSQATSLTIYMTYFFDHDVILYNISATLQKREAATPESIDKAQQILLTKLVPPTSRITPSTYHIGDIIITDNNNHIILNNGQNFNGKIQYHMYDPKTEVFQFSSLDVNHICKRATPRSAKLARRILYEYYIEPAFQ